MIETKKELAQLWQREASRSEIVAFVSELAQLWERESSRSEIVAFVTELVNQNRRLVDKVKQLTSVRDRFCSSLENLVAETKSVSDEGGNNIVGALEDESVPRRALELSNLITEVGNMSLQKSGVAGEDLESELFTMVADESQTVEGTCHFTDESTSPFNNAALFEDAIILEGEVEIVMAPLANIAQLIRVRRSLLGVNHLKILRTDGSWKGGSIITVHLDKPLPLVNILRAMPEVETAEIWDRKQKNGDDFQQELLLESTPEDGRGRKVAITLNPVELTQHDWY